MDAIYVVKREDIRLHDHCVCAEYDDLLTEAFDVMRILYRLLNDLAPFRTKERAIEFLMNSKKAEWEKLEQVHQETTPGIEDYLDPYFITLIECLARENESYFSG